MNINEKYSIALAELGKKLDELLVWGWREYDYEEYGERTETYLMNNFDSEDSCVLFIRFGDSNTIERKQAIIEMKFDGHDLKTGEILFDACYSYDKNKAMDLFNELVLPMNNNHKEVLSEAIANTAMKLNNTMNLVVQLESDLEHVENTDVIEFITMKLETARGSSQQFERALTEYTAELEDIKKGELF